MTSNWGSVHASSDSVMKQVKLSFPKFQSIQKLTLVKTKKKGGTCFFEKRQDGFYHGENILGKVQFKPRGVW